MIDLRPVTDAVLVMLRDVVPVPVYDAKVPANAALPYVVVASLAPSNWSGPWSDPHADGDLTVQVTAVGEDRRQVEHMADGCRRAFLERGREGFTNPILIPGVRVMARYYETGTGFDPGIDLGVAQQADRYRLKLTPA